MKHRVEINKDKIRREEPIQNGVRVHWDTYKIIDWATELGMSVRVCTEEIASYIETDSLGSHRFLRNTNYSATFFKQEDAALCKLTWG